MMLCVLISREIEFKPIIISSFRVKSFEICGQVISLSVCAFSFLYKGFSRKMNIIDCFKDL